VSGFSLEAATNEPSFLVRRCHQKLAAATMLLDGEAVVLDEMGRSDFGGVQKHWGAGEEGGPQVRRPSMPSSSCTWAGKISLASRRLQGGHLPEDFSFDPNGASRVSEDVVGDGADRMEARLGGRTRRLAAIIGYRLFGTAWFTLKH
jgi:hypothetical protein